MTAIDADLDITYFTAILSACGHELELRDDELYLDDDGHAAGLLVRGDCDLTFYASKAWIAQHEMSVDECVEGVQAWIDGTILDLPVPGVADA